MKYKRPSEETLERLRYEHQQEKDNLVMLELIVEYHINNPDLNQQREKVRRIKDKLIIADAFLDYHFMKKSECQFPTSEYCEIKINHSFRDWSIYGNCCKTCNYELSKKTKIIPSENLITKRITVWDELASLDEMSSQQAKAKLSTLDEQDIPV